MAALTHQVEVSFNNLKALLKLKKKKNVIETIPPSSLMFYDCTFDRHFQRHSIVVLLVRRQNLPMVDRVISSLGKQKR